MRPRRHPKVAKHQRPIAFESGRFIGPRAPDAIVGDERTEDRPAAHRRPAIGDGQRSVTDTTVNAFVWADARLLSGRHSEEESRKRRVESKDPHEGHYALLGEIP